MHRQETAAVLCNAPSRKIAEAIAERLISSEIAACVNLLAPCDSVYRWRGEICRDAEYPLLIKTTRENVDKAAQLIAELHPADTPEIIALPIVGGSEKYLQWVTEECTSANS